MSLEILHSITQLRTLVEEIHQATLQLPKLTESQDNLVISKYLQDVTSCANVLIYSRNELRDLDDLLAKSVAQINRDLAALNRQGRDGKKQ